MNKLHHDEERTIQAAKNVFLVIGGICWLGFAVGIGIFGFELVFMPPGLEYIGLSMSGGILICLVHFIGFCIACALCLAIGLGMILKGVVPKSDNE